MEKEEMTDYLIGNQEEMYQWAYRLTRNYDDAQDLLQSTLLCALKSVGMYTEENNISGWLYTIMRNIFFNTTRHSGREYRVRLHRQLYGERRYRTYDAAGRKRIER